MSFLIIIMVHIINKENQQHNWSDVVLVNSGTWVRFPGPLPLFHSILLTMFLCSTLPKRSLYTHNPDVPHGHWGQSKGPDLMNTMDTGQCTRTLPEKSNKALNIGPNCWDKTSSLGTEPPIGLLFHSFYIFSIFICFN